MKRYLSATPILALLFLVSGAVYGGDLEFKAELTGFEEVPVAVETDTTGEAKFEVDDDMTEMEFELEIEDAFGILGVAGAHIHCAPAGVNGPVVVFLAGAVPGGLDGKVEIKATVSDANIVDPACGATLAELIDSMAAGNTYVNVHSIDNPGARYAGRSNSIDDQLHQPIGIDSAHSPTAAPEAAVPFVEPGVQSFCKQSIPNCHLVNKTNQ
ncbi:CHRD domain-containing protein [Marinobacterium aestuariivivens]|uniref:CHRD domain-containing protein n=1 Tax=Marinobacterium aestuariivivens TaxID=1698799 RepID=A0ABW2A261_9GAMM